MLHKISTFIIFLTIKIFIHLSMFNIERKKTQYRKKKNTKLKKPD